MNSTKKKRGRNPKPFKCPWNNETIDGLCPCPDGRWRIVKTGEKFTEADPRRAVARFRQWQARQRGSNVLIPFPLVPRNTDPDLAGAVEAVLRHERGNGDHRVGGKTHIIGRMGKNYNLPPVMAALHAEQIKDLGTTFENVREQQLFTMSWTDEGRPIEVNAACRLNPSNIEEIFTYDAKKDDVGGFWAKGLAIADLNMQRTETLFWQQGKGGAKIKFHHRDALGYAALLTLARMKHTTEYFNTMGVLGEKEWPISEGAAFNQELLAFAREVDETRKSQAADVSIDRRQEVFPESDLRYSSGFEFTAEMIDGGLKVTRFRVDSSLASAWETSGVKPEPMMLACFIFAMNLWIDPSLRRYTKIEIQLPASEVAAVNDVLTGLWEKYDQPHRPRAVPLE